MKDCTRLSQSFWRSDILKSIGRSSPCFEIVGPHCLPAASPAARRFARKRQLKTARWPECERMHDAIDISDPSNDSFIQVFEMQPQIRPRVGPMPWRRSDPDRDSRRRRAAVRRSRLRRRHAARHRRRGERQSRGGELSFRLQGRTDRGAVRHPQPRHQPRAAQRIEGGRGRRRRPRRDRRDFSRAGRPDAARLPRPDREGSTAARFMIRASIESVPPIRRIKNREDRSFAQIRRRDAPRAARPRRGRTLLGPAFCAGDVAPHHPREGAADKAVGRARATSTTSRGSSSAWWRCR